MTSTRDAPPPRGAARPLWRSPGAIALLVIVGVPLILTIMWLNGAAPGDQSAPTAWENRAEMNEVLAETGRLLDVELHEEPVAHLPLTCTRNDGRSGTSYFLSRLAIDEPADADALTAVVAEHWKGLGYSVDTSRSGAVTAITQRGAVLEFVASTLGVSLGGETSCALRDGAPTTD